MSKIFLFDLIGNTGTRYGCYFECETQEDYEALTEDCGLEYAGELIEVLGEELH